MKKRFNLKVGLLSLALTGAGAATTIQAAEPQTVMAAQTYEINRNINIFYKYSDGTTKKLGSVTQTAQVPLKDYVMTFPETESKSYLSGYEAGEWGAWTPENTKVSSAKGSVANPPADGNIYLVLDSKKGLTSDKSIKRTINYYFEDAKGNKTFAGSSSSSMLFYAGSAYTNQYTFPDVTVEQKVGYTSDKSVIKGRTVTPSDDSFTEEVVYKKNANVTTEKKTVWRIVNFIDKDTGKQIKPSHSQGAVFRREVYKDANGKTVVVSDWAKEGTISAFTLPEIDGYTHTQKTIPTSKVKPTDKDFEVNAEYEKRKEKIFTVIYHLDNGSNGSNKTTTVKFGQWSQSCSIDYKWKCASLWTMGRKNI